MNERPVGKEKLSHRSSFGEIVELVKLLLGGEKLGNMFHICQVTVLYVMVFLKKLPKNMSGKCSVMF